MVARGPIWTAPITWDDDQPLDEDTMNEQVRNNLLFLKSGHLSIVTFRPDVGSWSSPAYTTTSATFADVDANLLTVSLTLEQRCSLYIGCLIPFEHSAGANFVNFDFFDGTVYASSKIATPAPGGGLWRQRTHSNNGGRSFSGMFPLGKYDPGLQTWTLRWATDGATARIMLNEFPGQLWLMGM